MRVSIVVPALNESVRIAATLGPLQILRRQGHEILVVDGGSSDGTIAAATPLADRVIMGRRGRATQMNAGAALAGGDVLVFLHADTTLHADGIAAMRAGLQRGDHAWGRFDVRIDTRSPLLMLIAAAMNLRSRWTGIATGDQAMFVLREAFEAAGGFPSQPLMEDIEFSRRLKRSAGAPLCLRARVSTSGRRWLRHGVLRTMLTMWRLRFAYWRGADPADLAGRYALHDPATPTAVLQVFAKAPVAGTVKTRLAAHIGAAAAVDVHVELAERTLAVGAAALREGAVSGIELWCDPDAADPRLRAWATRYGATLHVQRGGDLGQRMRNALQQALARGHTPVLVGTDCPVLVTRHLAESAAALRRTDAVFLPAEDGGYVLIGLASALPVFEGVAWGSARVMAQTRQRLRRAHARWVELAMVWDVDRPEDLARWRAMKESLAGA